MRFNPANKRAASLSYGIVMEFMPQVEQSVPGQATYGGIDPLFSASVAASMAKTNNLLLTKMQEQVEASPTMLIGSLYTNAAWKRDKMPFYRVYPAFIESLIKLGKDFISHRPAVEIVLENAGHAIALEFANHESLGFLSAIVSIAKTPESIFCYATISFNDSVQGRVREKIAFHTMSVDASALFGSIDEWDDDAKKVLLLFAAIMAIKDNPELIQPIPLQKDREKYEKTFDPKFIEKARRNGVNGFEVGKFLEDEKSAMQAIEKSGGKMSPHYRSSHLATQRFGKGRSQMKIILRKGSFVNIDKVKEVPMGYYEK